MSVVDEVISVGRNRHQSCVVGYNIIRGGIDL